MDTSSETIMQTELESRKRSAEIAMVGSFTALAAAATITLANEHLVQFDGSAPASWALLGASMLGMARGMYDTHRATRIERTQYDELTYDGYGYY